jgi:hypothetical protein
MQKLIILPLLASFALLGCSDTGFDRNVKTTKVQPQKPGPGDISEKLKDEAMKAGVLLDLKKDSLRVLNTTADGVSLGAMIELNQKDQGYRNYSFDLRTSEIKNFENRNYDLNPDSRLGFEVYRFKMADNQDMLTVHFKFENRVSAQFKKSSHVYLINLKATKTMQAKEFFFPLPEDFEIKKWSEKASKPQPAMDLESQNQLTGYQQWDSSL